MSRRVRCLERLARNADVSVAPKDKIANKAGMSSIDRYIHAATRANTRKAYLAAVYHFEDEWGGFLPTAADSVARYLVDHARTHALNTPRLRLAGLAAGTSNKAFPIRPKHLMSKRC